MSDKDYPNWVPYCEGGPYPIRAKGRSVKVCGHCNKPMRFVSRWWKSDLTPKKVYCSHKCAYVLHGTLWRRASREAWQIQRNKKAQAFEILMQSLEKSDADSGTKEAIGRLREFVEVEREAADGLH